MKILFLHLSDLHIKDANGVNVFQLRKIADSVNSVGVVDSIIFVLTGDIAFSGTKQQYDSAYHCIGNIITRLKYNGFLGHIDVLCVPGNHDVNHENGCLTSQELQNVRKTYLYSKHLESELAKQKAFFDYARRNHCFEYSSSYSRRIISIGTYRIEVNMINSGVFSILEEDKGLHYIPQHCINELVSPSNADFVITMMHHSPEWYTDDQKNHLERAIYEKSSIVFYGHEHYIGKKTVSYEDAPLAVVQAGGKLADNEDWTTSSFYIGIIDTSTQEYIQYNLHWNSNQRQYERSNSSTTVLPPKPSVERKIHVLPEFENRLHEDSKHSISTNFLDYYVFPRIQADDINGAIETEHVTEADFVAAVLKKKKVLICGGYNSGKTSLLKSLFLYFAKDYTVLFCDTSLIRGKSTERIIKSCFNDTYGNSDSDYLRFLQTPRNRRIIIIDDVDSIKPDSFDLFIEQLDDYFEYFVLSTNQVLDIDLFERMKVLLKANNSIYRFRILPVYADKRLELIRKVVSIRSEDKGDIEKITKLLSDAIKAQRRYISLDPDFIIKYVEYYCNNLKDAGNIDSGVFSKVFEANLTYALNRFQTSHLSVDKLFVLLSKIAHFIHFHKSYPVSEKEIFAIVEQYNKDYGADVKNYDVISAICGAKILVSDSTGGYRFTDRSYLAYYIAREINSQYNNTGDDKDLQTILKCACFGINADVLMFLSYITNNIRILQYILHEANELTAKWPEFNFADNLPDYLKCEKTHTVLLPATDARKKENDAEIDAERNVKNAVQTVDLYDYTDSDSEKFVNQIIRAVSLLVIIAKCLPNFEHNMLKQDKDAFVDAVYRLPNRIFGLWATEADKCVVELVAFFREQSQDFYSREKTVDDEDILRAIQWASISLLLDLYHLTVFYAVKDNTSHYISSYNYSKQNSYQLEHLMALQKLGAAKSFVDTSIKLNDKGDCSVFSMALRRIVSHALVYMNDVDYRLTQQLHSEFFPDTTTQKRLMAQRIVKEYRSGE